MNITFKKALHFCFNPVKNNPILESVIYFEYFPISEMSPLSEEGVTIAVAATCDWTFSSIYNS